MSQFLSTDGSDGNYADTPDSVALSVTGDLDMRILAALDDWTPGSTRILFSKGFDYRIRLNASGTLNLQWHDGSTFQAENSTAATGLADGEKKWIRATLDVDNGASGYDVTFYTSDDGVSWSQLGSVVTGGATTAIRDTTNPLGYAADHAGNNATAGNWYQGQVYDGIDGTLVADFNADDFNLGDSDTATANDSVGNTWTIHGTGAEIQAEGDLLLLGVG